MTKNLNELKIVLDKIELHINVFILSSNSMYEHKVKKVLVDSYRIIDNELILRGENVYYGESYLTKDEANKEALGYYEKDLNSLKYHVDFVEQAIEKLTK